MDFENVVCDLVEGGGVAEMKKKRKAEQMKDLRSTMTRDHLSLMGYGRTLGLPVHLLAK